MEKYQTLRRRFGALVIDSILLGIGNLIISYALRLLIESNPTILWIAISLLNLMTVFYFILLHNFYGQTIGKKIAGVKVIDDSESPINFGQSVLRSLPQLIPALFTLTIINPNLYAEEGTSIISSIILYAAGIFNIFDIVVCLVNEKHRALHDYIAGTIVIRTDV
jgi:uncharacterized RDD family membrane protein YckC